MPSRVVGRFHPGAGFAPIAHLFACEDERHGTDYPRGPAVEAERARLHLEVVSEGGPPVPCRSIDIFVFPAGIGAELSMVMPDRDQAARLFGAPAEPDDLDAEACRAIGTFLGEGHRPADVHAAIRIWKALARRRPGWIEPHAAIADLYLELALPDRALESLRVLADHHLGHGDVGAAEAPLRRIASLDPADLKTRARLADLFERSGRRGEAVSEYLAIADRLWAMGHRPQAIQTIEQGLSRFGGHRDLAAWLSRFRGNPPA
jgi:hypothetical protein